MKCPLIGVSNLAEWARESPSEVDCIKEECAWWNSLTEECAVTMLAIEVNAARAALQKINHRLDALTGLKK